MIYGKTKFKETRYWVSKTIPYYIFEEGIGGSGYYEVDGLLMFARMAGVMMLRYRQKLVQMSEDLEKPYFHARLFRMLMELKGMKRNCKEVLMLLKMWAGVIWEQLP